MSELNDKPEQPNDANQPETPKGNSMRLNVLVCILVLGLAAMAYDRMVARPAVEAAYAAIVAENVAVNATKGKVFTNIDVQKLIGKTPARTFTNPDGDTVEIYQWRAGLPIRTHDLYAIYTQMDGKQLFQEGGTGDYDKIMLEAGASSRKPKVVKLTQEDLDSMSKADMDADQGGGDTVPDSNAVQETEEKQGSSQEKESPAKNSATGDDAAEADAAESSATETPAAKTPASSDEPQNSSDQ